MPAMQDRYAVPWDADASEARALWRGHGQNCGAVEQESGRMNNDLVSREAVEQIFSKMWFTVRQNQNLTDEEVKQIITKGRMEINRLPPAQRGWIPCSERLPEEKDAGILKKLGTNRRSDYVIATIEVKDERMTGLACTYDGVWHWDKKYAFPDFKVVAWQPLPTPWEGGQDNG